MKTYIAHFLFCQVTQKPFETRHKRRQAQETPQSLVNVEIKGRFVEIPVHVSWASFSQ